MTTGPTSDPDHMAELVERHEISVPTSPDIDHDNRERVWADCARRAQEWAEAEGMAIVLNYFEGSQRPDVDTDVSNDHDVVMEHSVGVWWDIVVGRAGADQLNAGRLGKWLWSPRWQHWAGWFASMRLAADSEHVAANACPESSLLDFGAAMAAKRAATVGRTPPWTDPTTYTT